MPAGASQYDAIAFDMDLCFAEYKSKNFLKLLYESVAAKMVIHLGYPQEIFPDEEEEELFYSRYAKGFIDNVSLSQ